MGKFSLSSVLFFCVMASALTACGDGRSDSSLQLRYDRPADYFEEALPLGNGRLGVMLYGGVKEERLSLNDITLWTGEGETVEKDYFTGSQLGKYADGEWIPAIREALDAEDYRLADELQHHVQGHYCENYQPLGTLRITIDRSDGSADYQRVLDIADATASVRFSHSGSLQE